MHIRDCILMLQENDYPRSRSRRPQSHRHPSNKSQLRIVQLLLTDAEMLPLAHDTCLARRQKSASAAGDNCVVPVSGLRQQAAGVHAKVEIVHQLTPE